MSVAEHLSVEQRDDLSLATIIARKGVASSAIGEALGAPLPGGPVATSVGGIALLGVGPGAWLAIRQGAVPDWPEGLADALGSLASISDQSGGYIVLRLSGEGARRLLQRGVAIDLHPDVFDVDAVAVTMIAHIGVIIHKVDEAPTYDVAIFRSYLHSFRHWLDLTAAAL